MKKHIHETIIQLTDLIELANDVDKREKMLEILKSTITTIESALRQPKGDNGPMKEQILEEHTLPSGEVILITSARGERDNARTNHTDTLQ